MSKVVLNEKQKARIDDYVRNTKDLTNQDRISDITVKIDKFAFNINAILRAGIKTIGLEEQLVDLDQAFDNCQIDEDLEVYRFFNYKEMYRYISDDDKFYFEKGYMSTSTDAEVTHRFFEESTLGYFPVFLKIFIPKGSNVLILDNIEGHDNSTYENEVLIRRNAIFEIISNKEEWTSDITDTVGKEITLHYQKIRVIEMEFKRYLPILP